MQLFRTEVLNATALNDGPNRRVVNRYDRRDL